MKSRRLKGVLLEGFAMTVLAARSAGMILAEGM
jgi:hypothetical protein